VRLSKAIFAIVFAGMILGNSNALQADSDDISEYYGFEEIEIVKLDWGIKDLLVADFNGDGRKDIALSNNRKARIELLLPTTERPESSCFCRKKRSGRARRMLRLIPMT